MSRQTEYFCTLDLSLAKYCGAEFSFYLTLVDYEEPGSQRLYSPQRSVLHLTCGALSPVTVMESAVEYNTLQYCTKYEPFWKLEPLFYQVNPIKYRSLYNN